MPSTHLPLFERLTRLLDPLNPAELHGLLCGLLCADADLNCDQWVRHVREVLADDVEFSQPVRDLLSKLLEYGIAQLNAPDWSVTLLLPDDDAPLSSGSMRLGPGARACCTAWGWVRRNRAIYFPRKVGNSCAMRRKSPRSASTPTNPAKSMKPPMPNWSNTCGSDC